MGDIKIKKGELWKMFVICKTVNNGRCWSDGDKVKSLITPNVEMINFKMHDPYRKMCNEDWDYWDYINKSHKNNNIWSTYNNCRTFEYKPIEKGNKKQIICYIKVYNGDDHDGYRTDLRWEGSVILPSSFITNLETEIVYGFNSHLNYEFLKYEKKRKMDWIENFKQQLLCNGK